MTIAQGPASVWERAGWARCQGWDQVSWLYLNLSPSSSRERYPRGCTVECWGQIQIVRALGSIRLQPSLRCHETVGYGVETCLSLCLGYEAVKPTGEEIVGGAEACERSSSALGDSPSFCVPCFTDVPLCSQCSLQSHQAPVRVVLFPADRHLP